MGAHGGTGGRTTRRANAAKPRNAHVEAGDEKGGMDLGRRRIAGSGRWRRRGLVFVCAALTLAASPAVVAAKPRGCNPHWPVTAHHAGGRLVKRKALPIACATETGYPSSESTIAVTHGNVLIYSPALTENSMARSTNEGANWSLTYPAAEQPTSFWNTVDPDVIADPRTGWLFWSHATGPVRNEGGLPQGSGFYLAAAYGFQIFTSKDDGRTFSTADYSTAPTGDWEKVFVGPPPAGGARPVGYPDVVYLCANSPVEVTGPGRLCYKSLDGGATFTPAGYTSPSASNPPDVCPPLNFNAGVVDSKGTTYQPVDCSSSAYIVISHDEGASYKWLPVPHAPTGTPVSGTNFKLAIDSADNLYGIWTTNGLLYLISSRNHGQTWSKPMMVAAPHVKNVELPAVAAGAPGHVGITYYGNVNPSAKLETAYITQSSNALAGDPLFYSGAINDPAHPIFHDYGLSDSPRADFVGAAFNLAGTSFWAGVVKQLDSPDTSGYIETTGYVGTLYFRAPRRHRPPSRKPPKPHPNGGAGNGGAG